MLKIVWGAQKLFSVAYARAKNFQIIGPDDDHENDIKIVSNLKVDKRKTTKPKAKRVHKNQPQNAKKRKYESQSNKIDNQQTESNFSKTNSDNFE